MWEVVLNKTFLQRNRFGPTKKQPEVYVSALMQIILDKGNATRWFRPAMEMKTWVLRLR